MKQLNYLSHQNKFKINNNLNKFIYYINNPYLLNINKYFNLNKNLYYSTTYLLINNLLSRGLKQKFFLMYCKTYKSFYSDITFKNNEYFNNYYYYSEFKYNLQFNYQLFNIESCILWYMNILNSMFYLKCSKIPKRYRKQAKNIYTYKFNYIVPSKRLKYASRFFYLTCFKNIKHNNNNFKKTLYISVCDYMLNFKKSNSYVFKTKIYNQLLKSK